MKKYTLHMVLHWLEGSALQVWPGMETLEYQGGICMLDDNLIRLDPKSLYIGDPEVFRHLLSSGVDLTDGAFVVTSRGNAITTPLPDSLTLIQTNLSLAELYNRVHENVHRLSQWANRLRQLVFENAGLSSLLDTAAEELTATIMITNPGYKFIAGHYHPDVQDEVSQQLKQYGYHTYETIQRIHSETALYSSPDRNIVEYISSTSGIYNIVRLIRYKGILVARMAVMLPGPEPDPVTRDLVHVVGEYVTQAMLSSQGADYSSNAALGSLVADLIECRLNDSEELEQRLKQVKLSLRRYYHPVLVRINNPGDNGLFPWNYIMSRLQQAFRYCDVTTYRGDILLLARKTHRGSRPVFNMALFQEILDQYDGRAMIGNASEYLHSLAPLYYQIRGGLRIASRMDPDKRIYYFEEYSTYQIVEMAADSEQHHLSSRNLAHLCNNEFISLVLYDKKHGTDFTELLFQYLIHERNTTLTAKALFMHRNTMLYKIHKIEEIIGCTLDDPALRERCLFSYRVMTYLRKYVGDDILTLRRSTSQEIHESGSKT